MNKRKWLKKENKPDSRHTNPLRTNPKKGF